jgi:hypothetical protein
MRQAALGMAILIPLAACDSAVDRAFYRAFDLPPENSSA